MRLHRGEKKVVLKAVVRRDTYQDSASLMNISNKLRVLPGIKRTSAVMATVQNKELLADAGLLTDETRSADSNDLVIVVEAATDEAAQRGLAAAEELLQAKPMTMRERQLKPRTLDGALEQGVQVNVALISVPGQYAKREALKALRRGLHVLLFSDNVPLEDEVELKMFACERNLLMMGPGCGTAIIDGIGLAFANAVRKGPIGIVGAAGTGIQEVTTLIHRNRSGISQAIGTGGRDLMQEVGGMAMLQGVALLERDPETEVMVLISKPPHPDVEQKLLGALRKIKKPFVVDFMGRDTLTVEDAGGLAARTLEETAYTAVSLVRRRKYVPKAFTFTKEEVLEKAKLEYGRLADRQRFVRGLFSGGSLCDDAIMILTELIGPIYSNVPLDSRFKLRDARTSKGDACVDMGGEEFTLGRPHPMIDPRQRQERILQEAQNPSTAVVLLDVVLGYAAHPDPAGALLPSIEDARRISQRKRRYISFVASVVGTEEDPQNFRIQVAKLENAGVLVMPSNAQAARMAALIATRGRAKTRLKI